MAKGSNNIRGRSSDASKPYDVSNSFVKRVASRVTELLPQPSSWFSRWMAPPEVPNASDFVGHSLSSTITSRPPATSRAELNLVDNVDHHAPPVKKPRTSRYNSPVNQKFLRNDGCGAEDISPIAVRGVEPIAGPSSRDSHPELIASTPAVPGQQMTAKVNGDDCSETSESTSGCSSLVPQAQSSSRSLGGSRYGRSIPAGTSLDSLDRRRPSFNTTTFNSPLRASMRARLGSSPFYSGRTMYGGSSQVCDYARLVETSQARQPSLVRRVGPTVRPPASQQSSLPLSSTAKRILDALEQFSTPMIDAKKMPVVGTKRKLTSAFSGTQHRYAELSIPSTPDLLRVKRRERLQQSTLEARQTASQSIPGPASSTAPFVTEYSIRGEETNRKKHTGKVKKNEKLEDDDPVVEVKLPAAVLAIDNLPKIDIAIPPPPPALTALRQPHVPSTTQPLLGSKFVFSQPTIVTSVVTPVSVPTSTFKFSEPLGGTMGGSSVNVMDSHKKTDDSSASLISRTSTDDVLASFINETNGDRKNNAFSIDNQAVNVSTQKNKSSAGLSASKYPLSQRINESLDCKYHKEINSVDDNTACTTQKWECSNCKNNNSFSLEVCKSCQTNKNSKSLDATKNNIKSSIPSGFGNLYKKPAGTWECSTCLIQNKGEAAKCVACESLKPAPKTETVNKNSINVEKTVLKAQASSEGKQPESGLGNLFKKPSGSWTCEVCMINNNADKSKCAACETPKPRAKVLAASSDIKQPGNGFGNFLKKAPGSWICDVCMINNDADKNKCAACETPKPGAKVLAASSDIKQPGNGFGNFLKKAPGSWICDICMINNDADKSKCAACETLKPGETAMKAMESTSSTFSFGIPPASTSSSGTGATFSFGIPKGDQTVLSSNTSLPVPKSIMSSDSAQTPCPKFSFGIPKPVTPESSSSNAVPSNTSSKPTSQIGSSSGQVTAQQTNLFASTSTTTTTSNLFGNMTKNSKLETCKQSESEKLSFNTTPSITSIPSPATSLFGVSSEKTSETEKASSNPALFVFGSNKVTQGESNKSTDASSTSKQAQPTFMFGSKQEGFGSGIPSSTTNTLSSSSPSNVLKFGETKTVSSGSGAASISSVSTQASVMTPKPNVFNFGSGSETKNTFGTITGKETSTTAASTLSTENKPTFSSFGATASNTPSTFGSTNAFGSSTFASKEQQPSNFVPQTTINVFGATTTSTSTSTFSTFGQTNTFQPPQQENKPSPVFAFGSSAPQKESGSGGFVFNPIGLFQSSQRPLSAGQLLGFNNTPTTTSSPSTTFNFEPKLFGSPASGISPFNTSANTPTPVFGAPAPQQAPAFGEQSAPGPVFNFGSQSTQQPQSPANPVFEFGSNQQQNVVAAPTPTPTFMFGAAPAAPVVANPPAFDPNMKPAFNFTQGAPAPAFSAVPTVNSSGPAQPQIRKIRKAVRRTNISSVRN